MRATTTATGTTSIRSPLSPFALTAAAVLIVAACAPSRDALLSPVSDDLRARTGVAVSWRDGATVEHVREVTRLLARPLDADRAARVALLRSRALRAAFEDLGGSGAELAAALAPRKAEIELEIRRPLDGDDHTHVELAALVDVLDLLALPARRGAARADLAAARARATAAAVDVACDARIALYRAVAADQILALERLSFEAADASYELARRLFDAGNTTELALVQEQALYEQVKLDLATAEVRRAETREALAATLGLWGEEAAHIRIAGELGDPPAPAADLADLERIAIERSLELAELRARVDAAADRVGVARWSAVLPELGVGASAEHDGEGWSLGPAVGVSIPLLDWGQGRRGRAWAELRAARHLVADRAIHIRAAARVTAQRATVARERARHLRDVIAPLRQRIVDATLRQYNAMQSTPFELVQARQAQIDSSRQLIEAERDAWIAASEVDRVRAGGRTSLVPVTADRTPTAPTTRDTAH